MLKKRTLTILALLFSFLLLVACSSSPSENASNAAPEKTKAPELILTGLDENKLDTSTLNKPVFYIFWATWCPYCKDDLPLVQELYTQYQDQIEFIALNVTHQDLVSQIREYIVDHEMQIPVYLDMDGAVSTQFRVSATPTVVIVDQDGYVIENRLGAIGAEGIEEYRTLLEKIMETDEAL